MEPRIKTTHSRGQNGPHSEMVLIIWDCFCKYSGPWIPKITLSTFHDLELKAVLKWRDIYTENIGVVSLMAGLKIEGRLKI